MSRPEARHAPTTPDQAITIDLAPSGGGAASALVRPLTGADEMFILERRDAAPGMAPVHLETLVLAAGVAELAGRRPQETDLDGLLLGDRNRLMLAMLCSTSWAPRALLMTCSQCGTTHEVAFDPAVMLDTVPEGPAGLEVRLESEEGPLELRLPTGADLAAIVEAGEAGGDALLRRCAPAARPSEAVRAAIEAEIVARDPCAEIVFVSHCGECGAAVTGLVDPLALLLAEMERHGGIVAELDRIARAYHWSEADLLCLTAHRRRLYLRAIAEAEALEPRRRPS
jgi:hypothetical protein